jgi:hypothetical protein
MSRNALRPRLDPADLPPLRWLLGGVLSLLGISTVLYTDVDAGLLMPFAAVVTLAVLLRPRLPSRVPRVVHTLAFPVILGCFALDLWLDLELLPSLVRLDILLLAYRNLGYRGRREDLQLIVLGLFLVIVAGVLSVSPTFAVHLLLYGACALGLLLVLTLEAGGGPPEGTGVTDVRSVPAWVRQGGWRARFRRWFAVLDARFALLGGAAFVLLVAGTTLVFLALPRFQLESGLFLNRVITKKAKSGFSDSVQLGEVSAIQLDQGVALTVDVDDPAAVPPDLYWRMIVLDEYVDGTFRLSSALRSQFGPERLAAQQPGEGRGGDARTTAWTLYLEAGVGRHLPLLGPFERLRFRERQTFRASAPLALVALREDPVAMLAFRVDGFRPGLVLPDPAFLARWERRERGPEPGAPLQAALPGSVRDRILLRQGVEELGGSAGGAADFARRASAWLRDRHGYSLAPVIPPGSGDPVVRWLKSREAGHCELFAGSFVLLARAAGFPARLVTGFRGGSWNGYSNSLTVRNSDAHAWAELFDEAVGGWRRVDPLAAPVAEAGAGPQVAAAVAARPDRSWEARWDSLRVFWYRRIVSFDQRSQVESARGLLSAAAAWFREGREAARASLGRAAAWWQAPWDAGRLVGAGGVAGGVLLLVLFWRRVRWDFRRGSGRMGREAAVRREAGRWLGRLAPVAAEAPERAAVVAQLERLRFGAAASWPDPAASFLRARRLRRPPTRPARFNRS